MKWRAVRNEWNLKSKLWQGALGIEEDNDDVAVPSIICWFTRNSVSYEEVEYLIGVHNAHVANKPWIRQVHV